MMFLEELNSFLSGKILPTVLLVFGAYMAVKLRMFFLLHPVKFFRDLKGAAEKGGTSPFKALSMALAGTLGVGNISGVASAVVAGGAGAVFWMWISAAASMSVKYAEVFLAVKYRKKRETENGVEYYGGAMYYIKEGLSKHIGKAAAFLASFFAILLVTNSLMTGNLVQVNAAASVWEGVPKIAWGVGIGAVVLAVVAGGAKRVGDFTVLVIPFLSVIYVVLSLYIIFSNLPLVPSVFEKILKEALAPRAALGGVMGYGITRAVRFGVCRGIFSNEAGCGTAPTAHASANTKSPHHQGCFGIFEVFCDTIVLCTMTALVILMADLKNLDGIPLSISSYGFFTGRTGELVIGVSVVIFAVATVICQAYYGIESINYLSPKKNLRPLYLILSFAASVAGSVISPSLMWQLSDLEITLMTVINTLVVFVLSDEIIKKKEKTRKRKLK